MQRCLHEAERPDVALALAQQHGAVAGDVDHGGHVQPAGAGVDDRVMAYAAAFPYRSRPCYDGVREFSIYVAREGRGRGFGRAALSRLFVEISALPEIETIEICYMPDNDGARRLYASAGFVEEGIDEDGEIIARLDLGRAGGRP